MSSYALLVRGNLDGIEEMEVYSSITLIDPSQGIALKEPEYFKGRTGSWTERLRRNPPTITGMSS